MSLKTIANSPRTIFLEAIEKYQPDEWSDYLDSACGDDRSLRAEVQRLLTAHGRLDGFMVQPAANPADTLGMEGPDKVGQTIGRYKLLEQIGAGGMGVVYVAQQTQPVKRLVALKIIKPGMDSRQVIARFEAERQALALMDHPNIARILDGGMIGEGKQGTEDGGQGNTQGTGDSGQGTGTDESCPALALSPSPAARRPYFVMELVRGLPITDYCDQARLTPRQRLALFIDVCHAVQHAHQKGIIHRDIKPSNVMVTLHDGEPVVKVIDFGVAKAIGAQLADQTLHTQFTQMIGTPLYMSPEQAELSGLDIDTRSDVYSLGVLLYELLTGQTPFDGEMLKRVGFDEMRRMIREDEPPRPSARLSTLGAPAISTISQRRSLDHRRLSQNLRGELDWIVMKCLEKNRNRRYESASALADDVQRYLDDEPVEASPPSTVYRVGKLLRRHKLAFGTASFVATILLATTIGLSISIDETMRHAAATELAQKNERRQRDKADKKAAEARLQAGAAERQKRIAEQNFQRAREAVDRYLTKISETELLEVPSLQPLRKDLLELAQKYYQEFLNEHQDDPTIRADLAEAHLRLGKIHTLLGSDDEARKSLHTALVAWNLLLERNPGSLPYRVQQAHTQLEFGRLQRSVGDSQGSLATFQQAVQIAKEIVNTAKDSAYRQLLAEAHHEVGKQQMNLDSDAEALVALHESARLLEVLVVNKRDELVVQSKLAQVTSDIYHAEINISTLTGVRTAKTPAQVAAKREALTNLRDRAGELERESDTPKSISQQVELARLSWSLGDVIQEQAEALPYCERAVAIYKTLAAENPAVVDYKFRLAQAYCNLSRRQASRGWAKAEDWKREEAIQSSRESIRILEDLTRLHTERPDFQSLLGLCYVELAYKLEWTPFKDSKGKWLVRAKAPGKSEHETEIVELYEKAISCLEIAVKLDPLRNHIRQRLGNAYFALAERLPLEKKEKLALAGLDAYKKLAEANPEAANYRQTADLQLLRFYRDAAQELERDAKFDEAIEYWRKAIDICTNSTAFAKDKQGINVTLSSTLMTLAATQILKGDLADAIESYTHRIEILTKLIDQYPRARADLCMTYYWRGKIQSEAGRKEDAAASWRSALEQFEAVEEANRDGSLWHYRGSALYQIGNLEEAQRALEKSMPGSTVPVLNYQWWYLAMIRHRLGKTQEARTIFDQLDAILKKQTSPSPWQVRVKTEAAAVLGIQPERL
jgi:serine/threonine protein kinase/tetratricopeptide (TPR) repeat protein